MCGLSMVYLFIRKLEMRKKILVVSLTRCTTIRFTLLLHRLSIKCFYVPSPMLSNLKTMTQEGKITIENTINIYSENAQRVYKKTYTRRRVIFFFEKITNDTGIVRRRCRELSR